MGIGFLAFANFPNSRMKTRMVTPSGILARKRRNGILSPEKGRQWDTAADKGKIMIDKTGLEMKWRKGADHFVRDVG